MASHRITMRILGDGVYQVYVEIDGEIVPFVAVDSATGDYHG